MKAVLRSNKRVLPTFCSPIPRTRRDGNPIDRIVKGTKWSRADQTPIGTLLQNLRGDLVVIFCVTCNLAPRPFFFLSFPLCKIKWKTRWRLRWGTNSPLPRIKCRNATNRPSGLTLNSEKPVKPEPLWLNLQSKSLRRQRRFFVNLPLSLIHI